MHVSTLWVNLIKTFISYFLYILLQILSGIFGKQKTIFDIQKPVLFSPTPSNISPRL